MRLSNGIDTANILGSWLATHEGGGIWIFNEDRTAFYLDDEYEIINSYQFSLNSDGESAILKNESETLFFEYTYYSELNEWELIFQNETFTRDGTSIHSLENIQERYKVRMVNSILGTQGRNSGGNIACSILMILADVFVYL